MRSTLLIGLGGTGIHVVAEAATKLLGNSGTAEQVNQGLQLLCIDRDSDVAKSLNFPTAYVQEIGFYDQEFLDQACLHDKNLNRWFDWRQWRGAALPPALRNLASVPTVDRQLGRLCLYHDLAAGDRSKVRTSTHHGLLSILQQALDLPLVIICASLVGGTGGAIALDIAYLVRHILATLNGNAYVLGIFALANVFSAALANAPEEQHNRFNANQVAAIKEIEYFARTKYEFGPQANSITFDRVEPFDSYWLIGGDRGQTLAGKWPTHYFPLIASEVFDLIVSEGWEWPPFAHHVMRVAGARHIEYTDIPSPLTTWAIGDWPYWEDVYNKQLRDPKRPSQS